MHAAMPDLFFKKICAGLLKHNTNLLLTSGRTGPGQR
jgi:hypothetical protein